jgi:hypothetical protein
MDLYIHSPLSLHGELFNYLRERITLTKQLFVRLTQQFFFSFSDVIATMITYPDNFKFNFMTFYIFILVYQMDKQRFWTILPWAFAETNLFFINLLMEILLFYRRP